MNRTKCVQSVQTVFTRNRRTRCATSPPQYLPNIARVSSMKILSVTVSSKLSVSDHVQNVVSSCAQTLHALRVLRATDGALRCHRRQAAVRRQRLVEIHYGGDSPPLQTASTSRDFFATAYVPVTAVQTSRRPSSWSKTQTTNCSSDHILQPLLPNHCTDSHALNDWRQLPVVM